MSLLGPPDEGGRALRAVFANRCEQDGWSKAARRCLTETRSTDQPRNCRQHLTPDQSKRLDEDVAAAEQRAATSTLPAVCLEYEQMVLALQPCTSLPADVRAALAKRLAEAKLEWTTMADKRQMAPLCSSAVYSLKPFLADCKR